MKKCIFICLYASLSLSAMEEKPSCLSIVHEEKIHRMPSSPPVPCLRRMPSKADIVHDALQAASPRDYEKLNRMRHEIVSKNIFHVMNDIEEIRAELVSLKLELYDTSKEAKNNIKAYRKRKKNQLITGETDAVDKLISFTSKKIDRAQDNLDVIRLLQ